MGTHSVLKLACEFVLPHVLARVRVCAFWQVSGEDDLDVMTPHAGEPGSRLWLAIPEDRAAQARWARASFASEVDQALTALEASIDASACLLQLHSQ